MKTTFSTTLIAIFSLAASIQAQAPAAPSATASASPSPSGGAASGGGGGAAGPVQITQPLQGTTWKIGADQTITWQSTQQDVNSLMINLMKGDPSALQLVQSLATAVDSSKGTTNVTVPQNATEGSDYSIAVGADQSQMAYIGGIILSKTGDASSSASASGTAPAPSGDTSASGDTSTAPVMKKRADPNASASSGAAPGSASSSSSGAQASSSETSGTSATQVMSGLAVSLAGAALALTGF